VTTATSCRRWVREGSPLDSGAMLCGGVVCGVWGVWCVVAPLRIPPLTLQQGLLALLYMCPTDSHPSLLPTPYATPGASPSEGLRKQLIAALFESTRRVPSMIQRLRQCQVCRSRRATAANQLPPCYALLCFHRISKRNPHNVFIQQ
jgi:hypothetical protein